MCCTDQPLLSKHQWYNLILLAQDRCLLNTGGACSLRVQFNVFDCFGNEYMFAEVHLYFKISQEMLAIWDLYQDVTSVIILGSPLKKGLY